MKRKKHQKCAAVISGRLLVKAFEGPAVPHNRFVMESDRVPFISLPNDSGQIGSKPKASPASVGPHKASKPKR